MLICFYDANIIHYEFVPPDTKVNAPFYLDVLRRLLYRLCRIRPEYREEGELAFAAP